MFSSSHKLPGIFRVQIFFFVEIWDLLCSSVTWWSEDYWSIFTKHFSIYNLSSVDHNQLLINTSWLVEKHFCANLLDEKPKPKNASWLHTFFSLPTGFTLSFGLNFDLLSVAFMISWSDFQYSMKKLARVYYWVISNMVWVKLWYWSLEKLTSAKL